MLLKILIVDDSPIIRRLLRFFIEHNTDWQVCGEAENGQIAVEKVAELKPHAVILDLSMPVMNGLDAAREITRIAPKRADRHVYHAYQRAASQRRASRRHQRCDL